MKFMNKLFITLLLLTTGCSAQKVLVEKAPLTASPEPVILQQTTGPDTLYAKQRSVSALGLNQVWSNFPSSRAVRVALVGSGIDYNHEDLNANVLFRKEGEKLVVGYDFVDETKLAYDSYGSDTKLAGIIGAVHNNGVGIKGALQNVSLIPIKYINRNGVTTLPRLLAALDKVAELKPHVALLNLVRPKLDRDARVRNVELKGLRDALGRLKAAGIPVVLGAGNASRNFGDNIVEKVITEYENVIVVTSVDFSNQRPWLANYSAAHVHTTAPGVSVLTTDVGNKYVEATGTDVSAAFVAATIAYAESLEHGRKSYKDYSKALMSKASSNYLPELEPYVLGGNTLNILKFLNTL